MPQNKKTVVQYRRLQVSQLYLKGIAQCEIAKKLNVSEGQVSQDLNFLRKEWQKARLESIDEKIAEELAKIDNLEMKYWEGWEKSSNDHKKTSQKVKGLITGNKPSHLEKTEENVVKSGDPRFLQGIGKCVEQRCKLLGLDAPEKIEFESSFLKFLMSTP